MTSWEIIAKENAAALRRVIELHRATRAGNGEMICWECSGLSRDLEAWPCPTINVMGSLND